MSAKTATTTPARKADDNLVRARENAAKKATPEVAAILTSHQRVKLAQLLEAVAKDAVAQDLGELTDNEIAKLGNPVVETGLLSGYTPARYGKGRWIGKATGKAARARFDALRKS